MGTASITAVMSASSLGSGSSSLRCCTFLPYTHERKPYSTTLYPTSFTTIILSLPSALALNEILAVGVPPRALWLAGVFLRRKNICVGVVGTRTDWVLERKGGVMMTPLLLQNVTRFDCGGEIFRFGWGGYKEIRPWFVELSSLFVAPSGKQLALPMCWRGTSLSTISRAFFAIVFSGQSVAVVYVEGVAFRPRAVVVGRGVVAGCTCIFSQKYVYEK